MRRLSLIFYLSGKESSLVTFLKPHRYDYLEISFKEKNLRKTLRRTIDKKFGELREKIKELSKDDIHIFLKGLNRAYKELIRIFQREPELLETFKEIYGLPAHPIETIKKVINKEKSSLNPSEVLILSWINFRCITNNMPILFGSCKKEDKYIVWIIRSKYKSILDETLNKLYNSDQLK